MQFLQPYPCLANRQPCLHAPATACVLALCLFLLSACGGRSDSSSGSDFTPEAAAGKTNILSLAGSVSGLAANSQLVLVNNADSGTATTLSGNGAFAFTQRFPAEAAYNVTVAKQPSIQTCTVLNGSGKFPVGATLSVTCTGWGKVKSGTPLATVAATQLPDSVTVSTLSNQLTGPNFVATDGVNLYVTEYDTNAIRQIRLSDNLVTTLVAGSSAGFADDPTGASSARFNTLAGIATDGRYLYVGDMNNCAIRRVEIATRIVTTVVGQGGVCRVGTAYADGPGTAITLGASNTQDNSNSTNVYNLQALALSADGASLYFGDLNLLRKLDLATGVVSTVLGKLGTNGSTGNADGSFANTFITTYIQGMTLDGSNLYLLSGNFDHTLRRVDLAAQTVSTLELYYSDGSINPAIVETANRSLLASVQSAHPGFKAFDVGFGLSLSAGLTTDGTYLYIAALAANQITRIRVDGSDNGIPTVLAGPSQAFDKADGLGSVAQFAYPGGLTSDGNALYTVEYYNNTVRKIAPN